MRVVVDTVEWFKLLVVSFAHKELGKGIAFGVDRADRALRTGKPSPPSAFLQGLVLSDLLVGKSCPRLSRKDSRGPKAQAFNAWALLDDKLYCS